MCYYNSQKVSRAEFIRLKELEKAVANYNFFTVKMHDGFSYGNVAVLKANETKDNFDIVQMEWGFVPEYLKNREAVKNFRNGYKDAAGKWHIGYTTLNAKAENLFTNEEGKPSMYRHAAQKRRCLVLSTGFFEWRHIFRTNKKTGQPLKTPDKYPYHIQLKDREYFYMAGIWQAWTDKETGEYVETLAITTAPANGLMRIIHNSKMRMPTILNDDLAYEWLLGDLSEERITQIALTQYPSNQMEVCPIDKNFKSADEPAAPVEYSEEDLPAFEAVFEV